MAKLLLIEDEPSFQELFRRVFPPPETTVFWAASVGDGLRQFADVQPDIVVSDIHLPDRCGLDVLDDFRRLDARTPIIFITGDPETDTAIRAMARGAFNYLKKPLAIAELREAVAQGLETSRLMRRPAILPLPQAAEPTPDVLVGNGKAMQEVYKAVGRVAPQDVTVLILGESGTGKELVARALYQYSRRAEELFLEVNCAAMPETLVESELFGHEKGAFTGAHQKRIGKFEQCSSGTLFLDEIGDMTPLTQSKILRLIQEQRFERVGGNDTIRTNARLIAATNRDLEQLVETGQFRKDLYYRLNTYTIRLPALRDRREDLPALIEHFVQRFRRKLNKDIEGVAPASMHLLERHHWPGNLRELQSVLMQAMLQATGPVLVPEFLPRHLRLQDRPAASAPAGASPYPDWDRIVEASLARAAGDLYAEWLAVADRHLFRRVLHHTAGNLTQAARLLGIHPMTLRTKLRALGMKEGPRGEPALPAGNQA